MQYKYRIALFKNISNLIVVFRVILVFLIMVLLDSASIISRLLGFFILVVIAILDWLDGYIARKLNISSRIGGLIDTLGDRITENLLLIFFACKQLIPIIVPLIFVARSFIADFIRSISYRNSIGTFSINKSKLGILFVASTPSRALYLTSKMVLFALSALALVAEPIVAISKSDLNTYFLSLRQVIFYGSIGLVAFNLLRFFLLIYDSRAVLKEEFMKMHVVSKE